MNSTNWSVMVQPRVHYRISLTTISRWLYLSSVHSINNTAKKVCSNLVVHALPTNHGTTISPVAFYPNTRVRIPALWWPLIIRCEFELDSRSPVVLFPNTGVRILQLWWPLIIQSDFERNSRSPLLKFPNTWPCITVLWWPLITVNDFHANIWPPRYSFRILVYVL